MRNREQVPGKGFQGFAHHVALAVGSPWAFLLAFATIIAWGVTGPLFHFSNAWQLVINTSTTIVTFLMVFVIQSTQNRDSRGCARVAGHEVMLRDTPRSP